MKAGAKRFIIVHVADRDGYGYNEQTLPLLLSIVDSHRPDHRIFFHTGVVAHFRTSMKNLKIARELVAEMEALQTQDQRFSDLGIGVAEGELLGEFDWLGRVRSSGVGLLGDANNEAARGLTVLGSFKDQLSRIERSLQKK